MSKFCTNCGNQLEDYYNVCPNCGTPSPRIESSQGYYYQNNVNTNMNNTPVPMQGNIQYGWVVLGFFIPIVGWIICGIWSNTKPETAKAAGIAGTIGFVINLIILSM